jgi:hypothetical protein
MCVEKKKKRWLTNCSCIYFCLFSLAAIFVYYLLLLKFASLFIQYVHELYKLTEFTDLKKKVRCALVCDSQKGEPTALKFNTRLIWNTCISSAELCIQKCNNARRIYNLHFFRKYKSQVLFKKINFILIENAMYIMHRKKKYYNFSSILNYDLCDKITCDCNIRHTECCVFIHAVLLLVE